MTGYTSWPEDGLVSTPQQAADRLRVSEETLRAWSRAGFFRHLADGRPVRLLLRDEDLDELAEILRGVRKLTLALLRAFRLGMEKTSTNTGDTGIGSSEPQSAPEADR